MEESGLYNTSINIPIVVIVADPVDFAAAQDWATTMNSIDTNIHAAALYMELTEMLEYTAANQNSTPICWSGWVPDYPFP
jgi:hypothetical protein